MHFADSLIRVASTMHLHRLFFYFGFMLVMVCSFTSSLTQAAEPTLNGMAIHSELGKELFIGALYASTPGNNADTLTSTPQAMRMELKIVSPDGMATRRFSRLWIEGMAINNATALLTEQADFMVKFDGLFKGRLIANDSVAFNYEPTKGVNISVNNVLMGNIASEKFFGMLLKTWAGKIPLSTDFKEGILKAGKVDSALRARFDAIKSTKERAAEVAAWSKTKSAAELASEKEAAKAASQAAEPPKVSSVAKVDTAKIEAAAKAEAAREAARIAAQKAAEEEEKPALTAQTLLARQFYVSDMLKKVRSILRYPKRALERGQAGSVRVAVIINRQGKVMSTSLVESSKYDQLNDAVVEAITESSPFPPMPDSILGSSFEFSVPATFAPPK
jgi:periplasmic protein TonB